MQRPIEELLPHRNPHEVSALLEAAVHFAEARTRFSPYNLQNELEIGYNEAVAIHDWLADQHLTDPILSTYHIRCARRFVQNNPFPTLHDMTLALNIGDRRAFALMLELERRGVINIGAGFTLSRTKRMSSWGDLTRQLAWVSKKYGKRCEPELLVRTLYVDMFTAIRLAQYGEEQLGLSWKERPRELR